MNENGKVLVGVLAGLMAGAVVGFLLAPEKGSEMREKINDGLKSVVDEIQKKVSEQIELLKDKKADFQHAAADVHDDFVA